LLECLVALEVVERYGEDYALSTVTRLLTKHDRDLHDSIWDKLSSAIRAEPEESQQTRDAALSRDEFRHRLATSQWTHTSAAMQVAQTLEIGQTHRGWHVLDFGCGAGVWSAAMAYRDPAMRITAVDVAPALELARETAESVSLGERWQAIQGDPQTVELTANTYDAVIAGGWLQTLSDAELEKVAQKLHHGLVAGGLLLVPDSYRTLEPLDLIHSLDALRLEILSAEGRMRSLAEMGEILEKSGFSDFQFAPLPASRQDFGLFVAKKNG
jgi:cyclopropane fatty-acyl-phospholipid synthase-like methyltransferase